MIFKFLRYIKPIWYFNQKPTIDYAYFPTQEQIIQAGFTIAVDEGYQSEIAQQRDLAWRAFQKGFIANTPNSGLPVWDKIKLPLEDEYRFIRKNFNGAWVYYIGLVRILSLHNPFAEANAIIQTRKVKREKYSAMHFSHAAYEGFESALVQKQPLVSVIIPTLNRYDYLKRVLQDLEKQTYQHFEVLVVDQTDDFKEDFYKGWKLNLRYWFQEEKALWRARNEAIKVSRGEYVLLYDDDSLIDENWITEHLKALDFFKADISSGVSISAVGDEVPAHYAYFRWSDQLDTGNVLLKKEVFEKVGLFDRQFEKQRMGDGEFGMRCYMAGLKNISNCNAKRVHLKVSQGGLRQMGSWDGWRPKKLFGPRPVPSVLYYSRKYFGSQLSIAYIKATIMPSIIPYQFKKSKALKWLSFVLLPFLLPLVLFQVLKSWHSASKKLKEGSKIEWL